MAEMRLVVAGAGGRMGRTLVKAITDSQELALAGAVEDARSPLIGWDSGTLAGLPENGVKLVGDVAPLLSKADGIIDFTAPIATVAFAALVAKAGKVHIIGTTGLSAADETKIRDAAKAAIIVKSGNMSLGVNLLAALTKRVAKTLGSSFDVEIVEMHHSQKVDAPSGTAGAAERLELVHKAEDRMIFARGALYAALWARSQKPGLYSMLDVLELKDF